MKLKFYHWYNALLSSLLTLLGLGSCTHDSPEEDMAAEYGVPYVTYIIKGCVTDYQDQPIHGIETMVKASSGTAPNDLYTMDSTRTDAAGRFQVEAYSFIGDDHRLYLVVNDGDGPDNSGPFQGDTLDLDSMEKTLIEKGEHWSKGKYELKANIKLKRLTWPLGF